MEKSAEKKLKSETKKTVNKPSAKSLVAKKENATKTTEKKVKIITEVTAKARFIKIAPRKVRLVIDTLKNQSADQALSGLQFITKAAVRPVKKLIDSAVANAENNFNLDRKDLYIKKITANDGPIIKRWHPRAHGRSARINKRTSHIELILGVQPGGQKSVQNDSKKEAVKVVAPETVKKSVSHAGSRGPKEQGKDEKGFLTKVFNRKTG